MRSVLKKSNAMQPSNKNMGLIFNIQRFSLHDGPGIRTTVFAKGCPLRCKWCSNPESQEGYPEIVTTDRKCIRCGKCVEVCPQEAITLNQSERKIDINRDRCDRCLNCAQICPSTAIEIVGKYVDVTGVIAEATKDEMFYRNSGGGITISGGEPLLQWEFVSDLLRKCKAKGFHTALDTSGYAQWKIIEKVLRYVDLVLYDTKLIDFKEHRTATGVGNRLIMNNAIRIAAAKRTWLRYAVVPGFNDSDVCARQIASFASKVRPEKVSLLPYHALGAQKYERLGRVYSLSGISPPNKDHLQNIVSLFESFGLAVTIGY